MNELQQWCATQTWTTSVREMLTKLWNKTESHVVAYDHPGCHRTSNAVDRPMNRLCRLMSASRGLHGHQSSSKLQLRGWALLLNFRPHAPRRNQPRTHDSPVHRLNGKRYHEHWLHNLMASTSLMGFRNHKPAIRSSQKLSTRRKHIVEPVFGMIKSCAGNPQVSVARHGESVGRVATDMLAPQSFEDLAPLLRRRGRLRGIVRAQGWAEAEKAKAQRNPAAMREHDQIFGQAPRTPIGGMFARTISISRCLHSSASRSQSPTMKARSGVFSLGCGKGVGKSILMYRFPVVRMGVTVG